MLSCYWLFVECPISVWWTLLPKDKFLRLDCKKIKCVLSLCTNESLIIKLVIHVCCWSWSLKLVSILGAIVGDIVIGNLIVEVIVGSCPLFGVKIVNVCSGFTSSVVVVSADMAGVIVFICNVYQLMSNSIEVWLC